MPSPSHASPAHWIHTIVGAR